MADQIYEEGEYCAVCLGIENLGIFDGQITVCHGCYDGGAFKNWLMAEMEKALESSPNFERTPEGGYRRKVHMGSQGT